MIGVAFGVGFTFGPAIGGLAGDVNPRLAFWIVPRLVWPIGSGVTFSFQNLWRKISEKNSSCGERTRSGHLSYCVLITNFGG